MNDDSLKETTSPKSNTFTFLTIAIVLLAFALRLYRLDFQSLISDEGISLLRSSQPLGQMLAYMPVEHLPGYFVMLHFWIRLLGEHDLGLRFLSLWPSVLSVALIYRLAVDLNDGLSRSNPHYGSITGLIAALLMATGAFQVFYAQEMRMYSWLLAASLMSSWSLWRLLTHRPAERLWLIVLGYILSTTGVVYLHYYGFLVPLAHTLFVLGWVIFSRNWHTFRFWMLSGIAIFLLFLPWLPRTLGIFGFSGWREPQDPWQIPWRYLTAYTISTTMPQDWSNGLPWLYLALALLGMLIWIWQKPSAGLLLVLSVLIPLLSVFLLALRNPDFHERYTIFISGPLLLLVAGGLATGFIGWRSDQLQNVFIKTLSIIMIIVSAVLILGLLATNGLALERLYYDTGLHKPDYRSAALYIQEHEQPGDVILADGINPAHVFLHYYNGDLPVHDLRPLLKADGDTINQELIAATTGARRAWVVLFFHHPGPIQHWLAIRGWPAAPTYHNGIRVSLYGLPGESMTEQLFNIDFGADLILKKVETSETRLRPGQLLRITTRWQVKQKLPDYKFSLRLMDEAGNMLRAWDYVPQNWFAPTTHWEVGSPAVDQHALTAPYDLPVGPYRVTLRLYDAATGIPLETEQGQDVLLTPIEIMEASPGSANRS